MPEWNHFVRRKLRSASDDEVAEIAGHMEDVYLAEVSRGVQPQQAESAAMAEVRDWRRLRRQIRMAKEGDVTDRVRKVWFPGLVCFAMAAALEELLYAVRVWPTVIRVGRYGFVEVNYGILPLLMLCGGVAAYLSRRAGGAARQRMWAALFPAGVMALLFTSSVVITSVVGLFAPRIYTRAAVLAQAYAGFVLSFVVIPGLALLFGALPFMRSSREKQILAA